MKTLRVLGMIIVLTLTIGVGVSADGGPSSKAPGTWSSSINLQNPNSEAAQVVIAFYDSNGLNVLNFDVSPDLPANGSRSYYVPTDITGLSDGQYAVTISSNVELQVVANASSSNPSTTCAYNGISTAQTGTTLAFPGLYNNYYGFYSELVIQNTDSDSTTANVSIKQGATEVYAGSMDIPGNSTRVLAMSDISTLPSGNTAKFAATVTSNNGKNLAGVANNWTSAKYGELSDYNGYVTAAGTVYAPALYNDYYDFVSSLTVMNAGTLSTGILVTYGNGQTETKTLGVGESVEYYQPDNTALPSGDVNGVFSAKIEATTSGGTVYALVNAEDKNKGLLASYNCPTQASTTILAPVVMKEFYQWFSAVTVQNVGTAATNVKITYADTGATVQKWEGTSAVPASGTVNIIQLASAGCSLPDNNSVAATIESYAGGGLTAQPLVAVIQENSDTRYTATAGDYLAAYTAVAQ